MSTACRRCCNALKAPSELPLNVFDKLIKLVKLVKLIKLVKTLELFIIMMLIIKANLLLFWVDIGVI